MTTEQMIEARGEARGRAEGKAEGRSEALTQILEFRFGPLPGHSAQTVGTASEEQLARWTLRAVTAETLDEVFG